MADFNFKRAADIGVGYAMKDSVGHSSSFYFIHSNYKKLS